MQWRTTSGILLLCIGACGQDVPEFGTPHQRLRLLWQNDSWVSDSDRFFTNGFEASWTFGAERDAGDWLPFRSTAAAATHELAIGQDMFTPTGFASPVVVPGERPYAGWLHLSYRHDALSLKTDRTDHLNTWEVELGVVGPSSLADDVQIQVHELVGAPRPQGWSNQLHDEPGIVLGYARQFRTYYDKQRFAPFETDLIGVMGFRLGNVDTSARLGTTVRIGINLPRHFGSAMRPLSPNHPGGRLHLQAGVEGRLVLHNIFLDGNTYRRSASVDRNPFVGDFHIGLVWEPCPRMRISLVETFRTPEFDSPSVKGDPTNFTSLQVEFFF